MSRVRRLGAWLRAATASPWLVLTPAMSLAVALGLTRLGARDLWLDEATSWSFARVFLQRLPDLPDVNMTLYYWLLALWGQLVPIDTEAGLRGMSIIFAVLTVPAVYVLARRLFGPTVAAVATTMVAIDPIVVRFAQEARGYSLLILLAVLSTYLFVSARASRSWFVWGLYGVVSAVALYAHFFAGLVVAAHLVVLLLEERLSAATQPRPVMAYGLFGIGALPLLYAIGAKGGCQIDWIRHPSVEFFLTEVREIGGQPGIVLLVTYLGLSALAARALLVGRDDPAHRSGVLLLVSWLAVPIALALLVSIVQPVFVLRYVTVALPPLILLAALGLSTIRPRALAGITLAGVLVLSGLAVREWYGDGGDERWEQATAHVVSNSAPWDGVIYYTRSGKKPFAFYVQQLGATAMAPSEVWTPKAPCSGEPEEAQAAYESTLLASAEGATSRHERVWLIASHTELWDPPADLTKLYASLERTHDLVQRVDIGTKRRSGHLIELRLYERRDPAGPSAGHGGATP